MAPFSESINIHFGTTGPRSERHPHHYSDGAMISDVVALGWLQARRSWRFAFHYEQRFDAFVRDVAAASVVFSWCRRR